MYQQYVLVVRSDNIALQGGSTCTFKLVVEIVVDFVDEILKCDHSLNQIKP